MTDPVHCHCPRCGTLALIYVRAFGLLVCRLCSKEES